MNWIECIVHTTTAGSDWVSDCLMELGATGTMIEDRADIPDPSKPHGIWEIIDPKLLESMPEDVLVHACQESAAPVTPETTVPRLDESQLTEAEKKAIDDFIQKVDVTNPDHVLLFGADAQKRIADFSQTALDAVKTQDTGEVGNMLVNLVAELKGFQKDSEEPKGLAKLFSKGEDKITRMKARYNKVSANVETIAGSLESYQTQLLKDVAMFDRLYEAVFS